MLLACCDNPGRNVATGLTGISARSAVQRYPDAMHIELHRTFRELSQASGPCSDEVSLYPSGTKLTWEALLEERRVVVLSEAGSGKTQEILEAAKRLRQQGKAAFFLRLENVISDFDNAFEEGTIEEFQSWIASTDPGWLLLDSIDESRLKEPSDFDRAIRKISSRLTTAKQRTHLFITGRAPAWRPATDRALCEKLFPCSASKVPATARQDDDQTGTLLSTAGSSDVGAFSFKVVSLDDLSSEQVKCFAKGKGVSDPNGFLEAVERADAWSFTARPQDLEELTEFWNDRGQIGSRFDLMQNSIARRLKERDQTRDEARPLTIDRAREGARLVAAAATLMQQQTIRVPDGANSSNGLKIETILSDWSATECVTLLSRPLFDEAIYGSVRFHHRSVREFLAAEWFAGLLSRDTSRRSVDQLFFRTQYGMEVVVPSLRPILPWLVMRDEKALDRVRRLAPEIFFEGGDPSRLPSEIRRQILEQACEQLASGTSRRSMADFAAIQRFAATDLTAAVKDLIRRYASNEDVQSFLLRMVWQGRLVGARAEAVSVALAVRPGRYARVAAVRAIAALGFKEDLTRVRHAFASEAAVLDRQLLAELITHADLTEEVCEWLFDCLQRAADEEKYTVDHLGDQIAALVTRIDASSLPLIVERLNRLLKTPPFVEDRHCELSTRYLWLLRPAGIAVTRILAAQDANALGQSALTILRLLPIAGQYNVSGFDHSQLELAKLVGQWPIAKWALFWHLVFEERRWLDSRKGERLTDWWGATTWPNYLSFQDEDFAQALHDVGAQLEEDDKLIALSLAFKLYSDGGRQPSRRMLLKGAAKSNDKLSAALRVLMCPPRQSAHMLKYKRMNDGWKRRAENQRLSDERNQADWRRSLLDKVDMLRDPGFDDPTAISAEQYYLFERLREGAGNNSSRWSCGNWESLEAEFGPEIARAYRDGTVAYWRRYSPSLISEGAALNSTPFPTIFGLAGLSIEAKETPGWSERLIEADAETAFRYAMHQLNGFPAWFASLFASRAALVVRLSLREIQYELDNEKEGSSSQYLLHDVTWSGDWLWNALAPELIALLKSKEPLNVHNLRNMLDIIQSSTLPDLQLRDLAALKVVTVASSSRVAHWLAAWTGVSPDEAIDALERQFQCIDDVGSRTEFAMTYITQLVGSRRGGGSKVREAFNSPQYLKRLYLLIHRHVKRSDDIDRANKGVYSPELRDEAQHARERLLALLDAIPGKDTFLALQEISQAHPDEASRAWLAMKVKLKAEQDADIGKWSAEQVRDFNEKFERTPSNHRELFELAVLRLLDLKDDLEDGDSSIASVLKTITDEVEIRKVIGKLCRDTSRGRYSFPQEEELADAKRPDFRWHGSGFDGPVPTELKLADNWTGPTLFKRLEAQLGGDYLRDIRSRSGIFLLVYRGEKQHWRLPDGGALADFTGLVCSLQKHWLRVSDKFPGVDEIKVIGIDLTRRSRPPGAAVPFRVDVA